MAGRQERPRKRIPTWILLIGAIVLTAATLWLALATQTVDGHACRGSWAAVFAEANNYVGTTSGGCRQAAHIRFGISVFTGVFALSAATRLVVRIGDRPS